MVKMSQTQDEDKSCLFRAYRLSFRTAGCITEGQNLKLTHPDVNWKHSSASTAIKRAARLQQSWRCCFYTPLMATLTAAVNQQSGSWANQLAAAGTTLDSALSEHIYLSDRLLSCAQTQDGFA